MIDLSFKATVDTRLFDHEDTLQVSKFLSELDKKIKTVISQSFKEKKYALESDSIEISYRISHN